MKDGNSKSKLILLKAYKMKKIIYFFFSFLLLATGKIYAQGNQVSGVVSDSTGSVIVGASVIEKGTRNGTTTNASGRFSLKLQSSSRTLVISSVGYESQEFRINGSAAQVTLHNNANSLSDVVVVGYGKQRKLTLTGSVSSVSGTELRESPAASIQNTLAGRLPGFFSQQTSGRPGGDAANFYIRGISSYNGGSTTPLIIVDDIEVGYDQFARIDPNEIESLSILKDAATTAVYGVRGANGVVVVTTRRGRVGAPQITFRGETSLQQPSIMPHYLDAYESALLYNVARKNDGQTPYFSDADLAAYRDHTDPYGHPDVNWRDVLFKNFSKQYRGNFDISGGTQNVKYFISAGYLYQDGMVRDFGSKVGINNNFYNQRYNYRSNLDIKMTNTTDLRMDLFGNLSEINTPQVGSPNGWNDVFYDYSSFLTLAPFAYPVYNPDGSLGYSQWQKSPGVGGTAYDANNIIGRLTYLGYNRTFENNMNLVGTVNQKLDFLTRGLSFKGTLSYASAYPTSVSMSGGEFPSYIYDPVTNTYTARNSNVYRVRRLIRGSSNGSTVRNLTSQLFLNYDRTFSRHHVYGLALVSQSSSTQYSSTSAYNFIPNNFRGFTARVGYDYKQKYLLEFNGAYNGSDRFAEGKRYGFFPAVSGGWNISEEKFFRNNISFINRMKIRGSYGLVGNDKIGNGFSYYYQQNYSSSSNVSYFGNPSGNGQAAIYEGTLGNPDVSWEKEKKLDLGLEMGWFSNKLTSSVDYFNNNRYDILTTRSGANSSVSSVFGQGLPPVNLGRVNNKGVEVEINYSSNIGKDLSFSVKGTYSYAKNKILFMDEPAYRYDYMAFTGNSIGMQRVYTWIGFYQDSTDIAKSPKPGQAVRPGDLKYADLNGDGVIDGYDMKVQGFSNIPNTTAGLSLGARYKGFNVTIFFQGAKDFYVRGGGEAIQAFASNLTEVHQQAWTPDLGNNAKYPLLTFIPGISDSRANISTFWLMPGDYIRLKTAELGYALPQKWVSSLHMKNIRVYTNGFNLLTWTKLSKLYQLDPEINSGTDRVNYPPQRIINFGVSATF
jgi:TonB-linked SusC/RagA family outer membrane protein